MYLAQMAIIVCAVAAEPQRSADGGVQLAGCVVSLQDEVLVPAPHAGVLLTRRSTELRNHAGQISFPGGRIDPGETEIEAALREAYEEVAPDHKAAVGAERGTFKATRRQLLA